MSEVVTERPVLKAITAIMAEVGSVEKHGTNSFHNYKYAKAEDIAFALQKRMAAAGLIIIPYQRERQLIAGDSVLCMDFQFSVLHVSGDGIAEWPSFTGMASCKNSKGGFDDKAANKCLTAALKYFTLALFRIPTGDFPDADKEEDKPAKNGNGKMSLSVHEPDERGPGEPFNDIEGQQGKPKYKAASNKAPDDYLFIQTAIRAIRSVDDLQEWGDNPTNKAAINSLPAEWVQHIRNEFKDRLHALKEAA